MTSNLDVGFWTLTGYWVYENSTVMATFSGQTTATGNVTGLSPLIEYQFVLWAYNVHGESPSSSIVTFTTTKVPNKMAKPTLTQVGTDIRLDFSSPVLNGASL